MPNYDTSNEMMYEKERDKDGIVVLKTRLLWRIRGACC